MGDPCRPQVLLPDTTKCNGTDHMFEQLNQLLQGDVVDVS